MKRFSGLSSLLLIGALFDCAKGEVEFDTTSTDATSSVATGSGGNGTGGGSGGGTGSCATDCSEIDTPPCVKSVCNEGQYQGIVGECVVVPDAGGPCEDGEFCTIDDTCDENGLCVGGPPNDCGMMPGQCKEISCDEDTDSCGEIASMPGAPCQDPTNLCLKGSTCNNGVCSGGALDDCFFFPVPDNCHVALCNPMNGMCESQIGNEGQPCTDPMDLCTDGKTCQTGVCLGGAPKDCSALSQGCFNGECDVTTGQCFANPIMPGQQCSEATDDCNQGICDMNGNCNGTPINQGMPCDDGLSCTSGTTCNNGVCSGGTSSVIIYFAEDFASNSAGWTLGTEWQIGPAMLSSGEIYGFPDPATDHTASNQNNGVAGVVIGGNASTASTHAFYYLTSPPVNVANEPTVYFEFQRWLNSDYTPFMQNVVEVYNGSQWVQLWASQGSPGVQDQAWTLQSFDLTPYKNSQLRVRFGFNIGSTGVFTVSQWNVDDVLIASAACP